MYSWIKIHIWYFIFAFIFVFAGFRIRCSRNPLLIGGFSSQRACEAAFTLYATRRDAIWRDIQVLFTLCATSSRAVTWQQGIWDPEQIRLGNLNGCFDPTWHCVYLTDIPKKITSIRITQPHKHIAWNTNSSHWWVLIKVCWGVNPGCRPNAIFPGSFHYH